MRVFVNTSVRSHGQGRERGERERPPRAVGDVVPRAGRVTFMVGGEEWSVKVGLLRSLLVLCLDFIR